MVVAERSSTSQRWPDAWSAERETPDRRRPAYIRWVQQALNQVAGAGLTVDGQFGRRSRAALIAFQRRQGLTADGVVGPATERALIAAGAPAPPGGSTSAAAPATTPAQAGPLTTAQQQALAALTPLAAPTTAPTAANVVAIMRAVCDFHGLPFALGLTILDHESPSPLQRGFSHGDGVMQTIASARASIIPRIPRPLARVLLGLPAGNAAQDATLTTRLNQEFHRRLAVQIAAGVQEYVEGLRAFNGYVALGFIAYNAGKGSAAHIATGGQHQRRPAGISDARWETMCHLGAARLHQSPSAVDIQQARWRCDKNIPAWWREIQVRDRSSRLLLISYQYLRSIRACIPRNRPTVACTAANHGQRQAGTGTLKCEMTRKGVLDKLYDPRLLRRELFTAASAHLTAIQDDMRPLKVTGGRIVKMPPPAATAPTTP